MRVFLMAAQLLVLAFLFLRAAHADTPEADTPEAHLGKGYEALRQDRYEAAATEFRAALQLDSTLLLRARFPLAVALFELKQSTGARREFEAVRSQAGDHPNIFYYLGRLDLQDQNFASAVRNFKQAIANPPFPDTTYYLGLASFKLGDLPGAERWLVEAARSNPKDSVTEYQLALVYRKQGREKEAKAALDLSVELRRQDAEEAQLRRECAQKLEHGPREEAHAACQRLYDPGNAEKLTALGTLYGQHADLEAALEPLRRAAELAPQSPQMQYNLAYTYYQMNRLDEARLPLAAALQRWPDVFQLNALYGAVLLQLGDDLAAYQALHRAHQLNQQDLRTAALLYNSAFTLARKAQAASEYAASLRYLREAATLRPEDPQPHAAMAAIYTATRRESEAAAEQQQVERLLRRTP